MHTVDKCSQNSPSDLVRKIHNLWNRPVKRSQQGNLNNLPPTEIGQQGIPGNLACSLSMSCLLGTTRKICILSRERTYLCCIEGIEMPSPTDWKPFLYHMADMKIFRVR